MSDIQNTITVIVLYKGFLTGPHMFMFLMLYMLTKMVKGQIEAEKKPRRSYRG